MSNDSMRYALACRMFVGWKGESSESYSEILEACEIENDKTRRLLTEIKTRRDIHFLHIDTEYGIDTLDEELCQKLSEWKDDWEVDVLTRTHTWWEHDFSTYTSFVHDVRKAEECLMFADEILSQSKESIVLTLDANKDLIEILSNYEKNKTTADRFMEEFPKEVERHEKYRDKVREIGKVIDTLIEERVKKSKPQLPHKNKVGSPVKEGGETICIKLINWWRNL